jgi:hypothetical protein
MLFPFWKRGWLVVKEKSPNKAMHRSRIHVVRACLTQLPGPVIFDDMLLLGFSENQQANRDEQAKTKHERAEDFLVGEHQKHSKGNSDDHWRNIQKNEGQEFKPKVTINRLLLSFHFRLEAPAMVFGWVT